MHRWNRLRRWGLRLIKWGMITWLLASGVLVLAIILYGFQDYTRQADVIIVLGAGVEGDGSPSKTLTKRVERGAGLWEQAIAPTIICTGGVVGAAPVSEASVCRAELMRLGVPASAILTEESSINTQTNARYAKALMTEHQMRSAVTVSSRYHLLRARWLFWREGLAVHTSPAPINYLTPSEITFSYAREWAAFHWQIVRDALDLPHIYVPVP